MLECEHEGILSLNPKKLANRVDDLKITLILQNEMSLLILFGKHVVKQREDISRYGKTMNNSFLATVCSNIFFKNCLFKNILMHLFTKKVGKEFFFNTSFRQFTSS